MAFALRSAHDPYMLSIMRVTLVPAGAYMLLGIGGYGIIGISNGRGGDMPTFTDPESIEWYRYPVLAENPVGRGRYTPGKAFGSRQERALIPKWQTLPRGCTVR